MTDWQKVKALAEREGVSCRQIHAWIDKGVVEKQQLARSTAVRVRIKPDADDSADD